MMRKTTPFLLLVIFLSGCIPLNPEPAASDTSRAWKYADVRLIDEVDAAAPEQEIIAAYTRVSGDDLEIRLDFLKSKSVYDYDLHLLLDSQPGGSDHLPLEPRAAFAWDWLASFNALGGAKLTRPDGSLASSTPRLFRNIDSSSATARLNWRQLGLVLNQLTFQVFLTARGTLRVVDQTGPFAFDAAPPKPAPLLLVFWNTLPASTPAQTLRRWSGAHTGPQGHRHGLRLLLEAVERTRIPVVLLDLKTPTSLFGLEMVGGLERVRRLELLGLVSLPDAAYGDPQSFRASLDYSRSAAQHFGIPASPFVYAPLAGEIPQPYLGAFYRADSTPTILRQESQLWIPAGSGVELPSPDPDGMKPTTLAQLVAAALRPDPPLTVWGGDAQNTLWAEAGIGFGVLSYIRDHPWIEPLDENDLLRQTGEPTQRIPLDAGCENVLCSPPGTSDSAQADLLRARLSQLPAGRARDLAWQMFLSLTRPTQDPARQQLQHNYLGQVGYLAAAASWATAPAPFSGCETDLDWDGAAECILANEHLFTITEPDGGHLALAVYQGENGLEEWIGPTAQFALGLGDPSEWKLDLGTASDPRAIPGAFFDASQPVQTYQAVPRQAEITFTGPGGTVKSYRLEGERLLVSIRAGQSSVTLLPILIGGGESPSPGWAERLTTVTDSQKTRFQWLRSGEAGISIHASQPFKLSTCLDSMAWMSLEEDPDRDYPAGHFVVFPFAVLSIPSQDVRIEIAPH